MNGVSHLYRDFAFVFAAALAGGIAARRLKLPLILGYVAAGILVGPFTPGPRLTEVPTLEHLAEVGVILLMFSIGVEFSPRELARVKGVALLGGPIGILLTILLTIGAGRLLGWTLPQGAAIGASLCVASTMVMSRLLIDRGQLLSEHGRVMIGITLVEDFAVVLLTVLLPELAHRGAGGAMLVRELGKAILILVPVVLAGARWAPRGMARMAALRDPEIYGLAILTLALATAAFTQALGLSLALGAFLGGTVISGTAFAEETLRRIQPLRDAFVALFFVTVGALIDPRAILAAPGLLALFVGLITLGKFVIWTPLVRLFGYPLSTSILVGGGMTQIGELSYVLIRVSRETGLASDAVYNAILAASLITILMNAALTRFLESRFKTTSAPDQ